MLDKQLEVEDVIEMYDEKILVLKKEIDNYNARTGKKLK